MGSLGRPHWLWNGFLAECTVPVRWFLVRPPMRAFFFFWSSGNDIKRHSSSIPELLSPRASALLPPSFACGACRCYLRIEGSLGLFRALKPFLFHWASRRRYAFLRVGLFVLDGGYFLRCPKAGARVCGVVLLLVNVVKKKKK